MGQGNGGGLPGTGEQGDNLNVFGDVLGHGPGGEQQAFKLRLQVGLRLGHRQQRLIC